MPEKNFLKKSLSTSDLTQRQKDKQSGAEVRYQEIAKAKWLHKDDLDLPVGKPEVFKPGDNKKTNKADSANREFNRSKDQTLVDLVRGDDRLKVNQDDEQRDLKDNSLEKRKPKILESWENFAEKSKKVLKGTGDVEFQNKLGVFADSISNFDTIKLSDDQKLALYKPFAETVLEEYKRLLRDGKGSIQKEISGLKKKVAGFEETYKEEISKFRAEVWDGASIYEGTLQKVLSTIKDSLEEYERWLGNDLDANVKAFMDDVKHSNGESKELLEAITKVSTQANDLDQRKSRGEITDTEYQKEKQNLVKERSELVKKRFEKILSEMAIHDQKFNEWRKKLNDAKAMRDTLYELKDGGFISNELFETMKSHLEERLNKLLKPSEVKSKEELGEDWDMVVSEPKTEERRRELLFDSKPKETVKLILDEMRKLNKPDEQKFLQFRGTLNVLLARYKIRDSIIRNMQKASDTIRMLSDTVHTQQEN